MKARRDGFRAVKFGWGPIGRCGSVQDDADHFQRRRAKVLSRMAFCWSMSGRSGARMWRPPLPDCRLLEAAGRGVAGGAFSRERARSIRTARARAKPKGEDRGRRGRLITSSWQSTSSTTAVSVSFKSIGRIGGIGPAKKFAHYAVARGVTYVNHTFTSHLALKRVAATICLASPITAYASSPLRRNRSPSHLRRTISSETVTARSRLRTLPDLGSTFRLEASRSISWRWTSTYRAKRCTPPRHCREESLKCPLEPIRAAFTFVSAMTATALSTDGHAPWLCG